MRFEVVVCALDGVEMVSVLPRVHVSQSLPGFHSIHLHSCISIHPFALLDFIPSICTPGFQSIDLHSWISFHPFALALLLFTPCSCHSKSMLSISLRYRSIWSAIFGGCIQKCFPVGFNAMRWLSSGCNS